MRKYYDGIQGIVFTLKNLFDGEVLKWTLVQITITIMSIVLSVIPSLFIIIPGEVSAQQWSLQQMNMQIFNQMYGFVIQITSFLITLYVAIRLMFSSMNVIKHKKIGKNPLFIDWLVLNIRLAIVNTMCIYNMRMLIPASALLALSIIAFITSLLTKSLESAIFGLMCLLVAIISWLIAFIIHYLRTRFAAYMLVRGDGKESVLPKMSYEKVVGKTWQVFCAMLVGYGVLIMFYVGVSIISIILAIWLLSIGLGIFSIISIFILMISAWVLSISFWNIYAADMFFFFCPINNKNKEKVKTCRKVKKR
jgi:hypothetical protein